MREVNITTSMMVCGLDELEAADRQLVEAAKRAAEGAHAPYSHFNVGAAILLENGITVCGANQENAAFSSGTCGERSACFYAAANYPGVKFRKIAIAARSETGDPSEPYRFQSKPISPCGHCRQALMEYENLGGPIQVLLYGDEETYILPSIATLLPLTFTEF